jgi:hypothetical protein
MLHRIVYFCGAYQYAPHKSSILWRIFFIRHRIPTIMWSIFFMRHRNIIVEHAFLNAPWSPFLSIRVFLVVHIFFSCHLTKFMWASVREILGCNWNRGNGVPSHLSWSLGNFMYTSIVYFSAQCWILWNIHNKITSEGKLIG